jgi:hypothetical protein
MDGGSHIKVSRPYPTMSNGVIFNYNYTRHYKRVNNITASCGDVIIHQVLVIYANVIKHTLHRNAQKVTENQFYTAISWCGITILANGVFYRLTRRSAMLLRKHTTLYSNVAVSYCVHIVTTLGCDYRRGMDW